ncbi:AMP-binding protein [Amycolatopsis rhabdoformis]|uniref:AMP-binding protein n=1 Tax=Amycolatopsis rhabdoformis TaxID=1448059 RepID=A0ABZ1IJ86_9PSEU|nr:AMP-binding protein [Amycolatopsis rhabdoformis]WSE34243.1 AMP-binding protein [Amycolatopsis rhabdoformis]
MSATIPELLDRCAATAGSREVVFPDGRVTYAELAARARRWAGALWEHGIRPGDHVGVLLTGGVASVTTWLAAAYLGAVTVPVNPRLKAAELGTILAHADVRLLFADPALGAVLAEALPGLSPGSAADPALGSRLGVAEPAADPAPASSRPGVTDSATGSTPTHSQPGLTEPAPDPAPTDSRPELTDPGFRAVSADMPPEFTEPAADPAPVGSRLGVTEPAADPAPTHSRPELTDPGFRAVSADMPPEFTEPASDRELAGTTSDPTPPVANASRRLHASGPGPGSVGTRTGLPASRPLSLRAAPVLRTMVALGSGVVPAGWVSLAAFEAVAGEPPPVTVRAEDPALILYTSGTTAQPNGCVHDNASLVAEGEAVAERLELRPDDRFWTALPMFHCGGYDVALAALAAGCAMVHTGPFEPGAALRQLAEERCTVAFPAFETIWLRVLDHADFPRTDLSALRLVLNVGAPERLRAMQARIEPAVQMSSLGSTESLGFCCVGSPADPADVRATTSGKVLRHMEVRVVDPATRRPVPPGTRGELQFRGTSRFSHYHRDPALTADRVDDAGWFSTGDLVVADPSGRLSFVSRLKDMLKVGGENVSAAEVEDCLATHPACGLVQVVAAPDARLGEVAAAYVQLRPGEAATEAALIAHCLGRIATFKVPRYVRFVTDWPMSGTKIQKFHLRARIAADLAAAGITEAPRLSSRTARPPEGDR